MPVADAVEAGIDGPFLISGFYVSDGEQAQLCEVLAESFPPQCGGTAVVLDQSGTAVAVDTTTEGQVAWSEEPVAVEGRLEGGAFVVGSP